ncbi:MAG: DUF4040 domain-containing protein [Verrucomicrobia bacterium]|nr:DUF4040 domain-containing protein [Verrucomicrobiota bacterium]
MTLALFIALGLPLLLGPLLGPLGRVFGRRVGWVAFGAPVLATAALLWLAREVGLPGSRVIEFPWIPSLGINLSFLLDGLSLFFALVVSGMGVLVFWYANFYLDDHYEHHGRFYAYLTLFMAAMLGTVLANNLMLLFVFWELTGITSFLLIGFLHEEESSRVGARQALLITGFTGLLLLAGVLMVRQVGGSFDLSVLLREGLPVGEHRGWLTAAMLLMLLGAFGKSAQFPFHFWLPNAMAAPTPVSAYLHSATMVKLGVFLCARLFPLFNEYELWAPLLSWVAFGTMVLGAVLALQSHDLKAILAFSTVSQLGYLIGYYGLGPARGVEYDYLHILNHVFYKGGLFMIAGVVIHSTGIQDIRQLGGLWRRLPWLGAACAVAAATMAGVIGTTGFLSKEMMLKEIFEAMRPHGTLGAYAAGCVLVTSVVKVAFAARFFTNVFLGPEPPAVKEHFHAPPLALQLPAVLLATAAVVFGLAPMLLDPPLHALSVAGLHHPSDHLALWHGVTLELAVSTGVLLAGAGLYVWGQRTQWRWARISPALRFDAFFEAGVRMFSKFTKWLTRVLQADRPVSYLPLILVFTLVVVGGWTARALAMEWRVFDWLATATGENGDWLRAFAAALISLAVVGAVLLKQWTTQLISLSIAGFLTTFYFVLYRAPDLALTQILVEVVTLILVLVLLGRFPRSAERGEHTWRPPPLRRALNLSLAVGVGGLMTTLVLWMNARPAAGRIGDWFPAHTEALAEGTNTVNTILVDFRGFDTLGEITVLLIATLGALGLLMRYKRTPEEYRQGPLGPAGMGLHHPEEGKQ